MEVIIISGGLGNQMFQYAFYLAKKQHNQNSSKIVINDFSARRSHNGYELDQLFGIQATSGFFLQNTIRIIRKLLIFREKKGLRILCNILLWITKIKVNIITEQNPWVFNSESFSLQKGFCLHFGLWQTEKYFLPIRDKILSAFSFDQTKVSQKTSEVLALIKNNNSISIHIRRGDYLWKENQKKYENICTPNYYSAAMSKIENQIESPVFFVFSDDVNWVKENMQIPNSVYIDWNSNEDSWQDMFLMSQCKHNIIANSTFSWCGAWLNQSPQKIVIAPSHFLNAIQTPDLIPDQWITIEATE